MSEAVGNPKDRFSHNAPQMNVVGAHRNQNSLSEVILMSTHHIILFNTYNTKLIQNTFKLPSNKRHSTGHTYM